MFLKKSVILSKTAFNWSNSTEQYGKNIMKY